MQIHPKIFDLNCDEIRGELCMLGGIYTDEKCPVCGSIMVDNGFTAIACPKHQDQIARRVRVRFKFECGSTQRQFTRNNGLQSYVEARRFLDGIRFKADEGVFDHRDYKADNPLGFYNLASKWLEIKKAELKPDSYRPLKRYVGYAAKVWGNRNVKEIQYAELEDFLTITLAGLSSKSRANIKSCLSTFFTWCRKRRVMTRDQLPDFPEIDVKMGLRKILDKNSQQAVLDKLKENTWSTNPKIWICVKWLSTYFSIRPGEMLALKEKHIDPKVGAFYLEAMHEKTGEGRIVEMLPEDIDLLKSIPRGFPEMYFFRHLVEHKGPKRTLPGDPLHHNYIYRKWMDACADLGIRDVPLYPGTKHTSVSALGERFTPEEIQKASQISTNRAFARCFRPNPQLIKSVYSTARGGDPEVTPIFGDRKPKK